MRYFLNGIQHYPLKTEKGKGILIVENILHNSYSLKTVNPTTCKQKTFEQERNATTKYVKFTYIRKRQNTLLNYLEFPT
jgi:ABC-type tungstate transport system permease subunit